MHIKQLALPAFMLLALTAACTGRKDGSLQATPAVADDTTLYPDSLVAMQNLTYADTLTWRGRPARFEIERQADTSLPKVQDAHHIHYVDNRIRVTVMRGEKRIFDHTFTKTDFDALLDDEFKQIGILSGIMFDKVQGADLLFAGSVSDPSQDDWYLPFTISITPTGSMTLKRATQLDVGAPEENEEEGV